jgi:hypothetical protein
MMGDMQLRLSIIGADPGSRFGRQLWSSSQRGLARVVPETRVGCPHVRLRAGSSVAWTGTRQRGFSCGSSSTRAVDDSRVNFGRFDAPRRFRCGRLEAGIPGGMPTPVPVTQEPWHVLSSTRHSRCSAWGQRTDSQGSSRRQTVGRWSPTS